MNSEYDGITAFHYASYRPSLHTDILKSCLRNTLFDFGLDIGCGTGQSAVALSEFCNSVAGIDLSKEMISKGIVQSGVSYSLFDGNHIDYENNTFDIITLAGSLWYAKSQYLLNEIIRVGSKSALVLVYDFEVLLEDVLNIIGFDSKVDSADAYNHEEDFSGLNAAKISEVEKGFDKVQIKITAIDLAHLILSVKAQYVALGDLYGVNGLYDKIVIKLNAIADSEYFDIQANTFSTSYKVN